MSAETPLSSPFLEIAGRLVALLGQPYDQWPSPRFDVDRHHALSFTDARAEKNTREWTAGDGYWGAGCGCEQVCNKTYSPDGAMRYTCTRKSKTFYWDDEHHKVAYMRKKLRASINTTIHSCDTRCPMTLAYQYLSRAGAALAQVHMHVFVPPPPLPLGFDMPPDYVMPQGYPVTTNTYPGWESAIMILRSWFMAKLPDRMRVALPPNEDPSQGNELVQFREAIRLSELTIQQQTAEREFAERADARENMDVQFAVIINDDQPHKAARLTSLFEQYPTFGALNGKMDPLFQAAIAKGDIGCAKILFDNMTDHTKAFRMLMSNCRCHASLTSITTTTICRALSAYVGSTIINNTTALLQVISKTTGIDDRMGLFAELLTYGPRLELVINDNNGEKWTQGELCLLQLTRTSQQRSLKKITPCRIPNILAILRKSPVSFTPRSETPALRKIYDEMALDRFEAVESVFGSDIARELLTFDLGETSRRVVSRAINHNRVAPHRRKRLKKLPPAKK